MIIVLLGSHQGPIPSAEHLQKEMFVPAKANPKLAPLLRFESRPHGPYSARLDDASTGQLRCGEARKVDETGGMRLTAAGRRAYDGMLANAQYGAKLGDPTDVANLTGHVYDSLTVDELLFLIRDYYPEHADPAGSCKCKTPAVRRQLADSLLKKEIVTPGRYLELIAGGRQDSAAPAMCAEETAASYGDGEMPRTAATGRPSPSLCDYLQAHGRDPRRPPCPNPAHHRRAHPRRLPGQDAATGQRAKRQAGAADSRCGPSRIQGAGCEGRRRGAQERLRARPRRPPVRAGAGRRDGQIPAIAGGLRKRRDGVPGRAAGPAAGERPMRRASCGRQASTSCRMAPIKPRNRTVCLIGGLAAARP